MKNRSNIERYRAMQHGYIYAFTRQPLPFIKPLSEIELSRRYQRIGNTLFSRCFQDETGNRIPSNFNEKHIVENTFFGSFGQLNKMLRRKEYYLCNAQIFLRYMDQISGNITAGQTMQRNIAREMLFNSIYLLQEYSWLNKQPATDYGVGKSHQDRFTDVFINSKRLAWIGQTEEINLAVATIRLAIENRIRTAFGIYGLYNNKTNQTIPVNMSDIFEQIKKHETSINIKVSIDLLYRIYSWSNNYIHVLFATYPWLVLFAHDVVAPLFGSGTHNRRMGIRYTILAPRAVIESVRTVSNYNTTAGPDWEIDGPDIDQCDIGIT